MARPSDDLIKRRPEAFDSGDTPIARGLKVSYLEKILPDHIKAALQSAQVKSKKALENLSRLPSAMPGRSTLEVAVDEAQRLKAHVIVEPVDVPRTAHVRQKVAG